jgi:hypothetical protein
MVSEIPQRQVITAISDTEDENYVAQLLYSQGFNVIHRAVDFAALEKALSDRGLGSQTTIISTGDFEGIDETWIVENALAGVTVISLNGIALNAHSIMTFIRSQLRLPLVHPSLPLRTETGSSTVSASAKQETISVSGTLGSPGRSFVALRLAQEVHRTKEVELIDADIRDPSLAYLCGIHEVRLPLIVLNRSERPSQLPDSTLLHGGTRVVDLGPLPKLEEMVEDRRWHANLLNRAIDQSTRMIFVVHSSGLGLLRLERFIKEFPVLLRKIPITYVLNQSGTTKQDRAVRERFLLLTTGESQSILPRTDGFAARESSKRTILPATKQGNPFDTEIARIAKALAG